MNELALFAGAGGGILGGFLLGWRTVCAVEINDYARRVLMQRQDDGILEPFPIWDDIRTFDGNPWHGIVDVVSGGFPCQDISSAGKGKGIDGERSGLWVEMARVIREVRPRFVFVENSPMLTSRGLGRVLGDLASMGYDAQWGVVGADYLGAPHRRERIWILANSTEIRRIVIDDADVLRVEPEEENSETFRNSWTLDDVSGEVSSVLSDSAKVGLQRSNVAMRKNEGGRARTFPESSRRDREPISSWWSAEPNVGRVANGVAFRVDRLSAIGNGQVPAVAATAFRILSEGLITGEE